MSVKEGTLVLRRKAAPIIPFLVGGGESNGCHLTKADWDVNGYSFGTTMATTKHASTMLTIIPKAEIRIGSLSKDPYHGELSFNLR